MKVNLYTATTVAVVLAALVAGSSVQAAQDGEAIPDHYIVKLKPNVNAQAVANEMANRHGVQAGHVYRHAMNGFSAKIPAGRLKALSRDNRVLTISEDRYVSIDKKCATPPCKGDSGEPPTPPAAQVLPTGIQRIGGHLSSTLANNGSGSVDVDVAVIDTGVANHPDLNVVGGINCSKGRPNNYGDGHGHGTHVAGTIAAIDNDSGVVGVAPGARVWAVRVLDNSGSGSYSSIICGVDWVTSQASTIEVANMSLGGAGPEGHCSDGSMHEAICQSVNAGVSYVVAAGNSAQDAAGYTPASYDEVITVSALADFDGLAGSLGSATCRPDEDDTFANFSNYGLDVDIIAPGVCIESTWNDGNTHTISGTSMAAPHVAGAAALYLANNPGVSPSAVKDVLVGSGNFNWNSSQDPDGAKEPLLDVSSF